MDTAHWHQEFGLVKPMQELIMSSTPAISTPANNCNPPTLTTIQVEKKTRPPKAKAVNCPRCKSTNTKFCYYNNYSLTQPRYFCKTCRRYWTEGGTLRNVPIGGGSRKNKRTMCSLNSSSTTSTATVGTTVPANASAVGTTDKKLHSELMAPLAFPYPNKMHEFSGFPNLEGDNGNSNNNSSAMDLLRSTVLLSGRASGIGGFAQMGMPGISAYNTAFGLQEFRPSGGQNFHLDALIGSGASQGFSFEGLKPAAEASGSGVGQFELNRGQARDAPGYWNGMIGGGGPWVG